MSDERSDLPMPEPGPTADLPVAAESQASVASGFDEHEMEPIERLIRVVLLVGIAISVALMASGLVISLVDGGAFPTSVVPVRELPGSLRDLDAAAYLSLGLIVLVATPFVRVGGSIVAFALEGDRRYVVITAVVFAVMCLSVLLGQA